MQAIRNCENWEMCLGTSDGTEKGLFVYFGFSEKKNKGNYRNLKIHKYNEYTKIFIK